MSDPQREIAYIKEELKEQKEINRQINDKLIKITAEFNEKLEDISEYIEKMKEKDRLFKIELDKEDELKQKWRILEE